MSKKQIDEELVSSDCLAHFLKNKGGCNKVSVKRNEDDPPDFWFTIDDIKYSIEVTSIVTGQDYHANIKRLTQIIKKSSLENDILSGKYALYIFRKPNIPRKNTTTWRDLVNLSLSFIQATKDLSSTDPLKLFKDSKGYVQIEKIEKHGSSLDYLFTPPLQWERDTQAELTQLMQNAVYEKRKKLLKKGVPDVCPNNILLFYDTYGTAVLDDAKKALSNVEGYRWFHSIFWAASFTERQNELYPDEPGRIGTFLYSSNKNWIENSQN